MSEHLFRLSIIVVAKKTAVLSLSILMNNVCFLTFVLHVTDYRRQWTVVTFFLC